LSDFERPDFLTTLLNGAAGKWERQKMIKQTRVNGFLISTVLPADTEGHYETMVFQTDPFGKVTDWSNLDVKYSSTEKLAIEDHDELVEKWKYMK
jgi:hypothetical protein